MELDAIFVEALIGVCITATSALIGFLFKTSRDITMLKTLMQEHLAESKSKDEQLDKVRLRLERMVGFQEGKDALSNTK